MARWNKKLFDENLAPGISTFTAAAIPDLRPNFPEWPHWIGNYFLNSVFIGTYKEPQRLYAFNFVKRADATLRFYHDARETTLAYLESVAQRESPKLALYFKALAEWETTFMHYAICLDLVKTLLASQQPNNDGSPEATAIRQINNRIKHHAEDIRDGHNAAVSKIRHLGAGDTVPFWLTNDGFQTKEYQLKYGEMAEELESAAKFADDIHSIQKVAEREKARQEASGGNGA